MIVLCMLQTPAAATALLVTTFQIMFPSIAFLRHGAKLGHAYLQWSLPVIIVLTCHAAQIGLALHPEGYLLLAAHLPFSFRGPLVLVCVTSSLIMCELSFRLRFLTKSSSAVHPALGT